MKRRSISIVLVFCLLFGLLVTLEKPQEAQAAKKFEDYMEISTAEDLADIINEPEGKYYLTKDIDMEEYGLWEPIAGFTGILDGNGHTIKNLKSNKGGLFAEVIGNAEARGTTGIVRNLELKNVSITTSAGYVGAIAGKLQYGLVENCAVSGVIACTGTFYGVVGGICGEVQNAMLDRCINQATIEAHASKYDADYAKYLTYTYARLYCGGIAGTAGGDVQITQCINQGAVNGKVSLTAEDQGIRGGTNLTMSLSGYVGGIVGSLSYNGLETTMLIKNCYNTGKISADKQFVHIPFGYGSAFRNVTRESEIYVGGICGVTQLGKQKINYCLNTGEVLGDVRGAIVGRAGVNFYSTRCVFLRDTKAEINTGIEWYGGGTINGCTAKVLNSSGLKKQKYYKNWDFENTWSIISGINGGKPMLKSASVVNIYKLDDVKTNVKAGTYDDTQTIELSAAEGAKIYYTLDGSKPSKKSLVYSGPITVSENTTIRAYAVKKGYTSSKAVKFKYKIK